MRNKRIYNRNTKGFVIDIFVGKKLHTTTDWYKKCGEARKHFISNHPNVKILDVKALYRRSGETTIVPELCNLFVEID